MKSGLEGRNNLAVFMLTNGRAVRLNEVRPRRPEQLGYPYPESRQLRVSMKSGLEGRNNPLRDAHSHVDAPVSMKSGLEGRNNEPEATRRSHLVHPRLNEVRPRRPEQYWAREVSGYRCSSQ